MTDGIGLTTYAYHSAGTLGGGQLSSTDGPLTSDTITYTYDELGRPAARTLGGATRSQTFDALGRVATVVDPIGTFTFAYDGHTQRVQQLTYPNGQTSTYTFFGNSGDRRVQDIHHQVSGGATLSRFTYNYDGVGNISTWTQQYETTIRAYDFAYDAANQLLGAVYRTTAATPTVLTRYGYGFDKAGNRVATQVDDAPATWSYNARNQLTAKAAGGTLRFEGTVSETAVVTVQGRPATVDATNRFVGAAAVAPGTTTVPVVATDASGNTRTENYEVDVTAASASYSYDANGNLASAGTRTFEWNAKDQLVRVLDNGTETAAFAYDGYGRRVHKTAGGVDRAYVYDGQNIVEDRVAGGGVSRHVHGPSVDQPLATVDGSGTTYYLADHLGSVVQRTSAAGLVIATRQYDPFGVPLAGGAHSGYAFTGREWDAETGLYYYRARYYDAAAGRFLSADPSGMVDGPNLYSYVSGRPTSARDPSGRVIVLVIAGASYVLTAAEAAALYTLVTLTGMAIAEAITNIINSRRDDLDDEERRQQQFEEAERLRKQGRDRSEYPKEENAWDTFDDLTSQAQGPNGPSGRIDSTGKSKQRQKDALKKKCDP